VVDVVLLAELGHAADAGAREARLLGPRTILQPGVEHAAVVRTLVLRDRMLLLHDPHTLDASLEKGVRRGETYDATADDGDTGGGVVGHWAVRMRVP
jgi:hypothetical protein